MTLAISESHLVGCARQFVDSFHKTIHGRFGGLDLKTLVMGLTGLGHKTRSGESEDVWHLAK